MIIRKLQRLDEGIRVIDEISNSYIYETDIEVKNLQLGRHGIQGKEDQSKYYKTLVDCGDAREIAVSTEIKKIVFKLDIKDLIIDGYQARDYVEIDIITRRLGAIVGTKYTNDPDKYCKYGETDENITISISGFEDNPGIYDMRNYGYEMDKAISIIHEAMEKCNINRGRVKIIFDNYLFAIPVYSS